MDRTQLDQAYCENELAFLDLPELTPLLRRFWRKTLFVAVLPKLVFSAREAGLNKNQLMQLLASMLENNNFDFAELDWLAESLTATFVKTKILHIPIADQLEHLEKIVSLRSVDDALRILPIAFEYGLSADRISILVQKLNKNQGSLEDRIYKHLPNLFRALIAYQVNPDLGYKLLSALFNKQYITSTGSEWPWPVEMITEILPLHFEFGVIGYGLNADEVTRTLTRAIRAKSTTYDFNAHPHLAAIASKMTERRLLSSGEDLTSTDATPMFRRVDGRLRHSLLRYKVVRSYNLGLQDLRALCLANNEPREGAFLFNEATQTWFALGALTIVKLEEGVVNTIFASVDAAMVGEKLRFVHIHPRSVEFLMTPPSEALIDDRFAPLLAKLSAVLPSRRDIEFLNELTTKASRPVKIIGTIVHSLGETDIHFDSNYSTATDDKALYARARQAVLYDPNLDVSQLLQMNEVEVLNFIISRLNVHLAGRIKIAFTPR